MGKHMTDPAPTCSTCPDCIAVPRTDIYPVTDSYYCDHLVHISPEWLGFHAAKTPKSCPIQDLHPAH